MSIPLPTALLRAMQKVYGENWDRDEMFAEIMERMESTLDRTGDDEKMVADAFSGFIEEWMHQQEMNHLEDDDFDYEATEIECIGKLKAAWRAELSADILAQPSCTELSPDERAVLGGDKSSTRLQ
jgi:hypothetical protein